MTYLLLDVTTVYRLDCLLRVVIVYYIYFKFYKVVQAGVEPKSSTYY